MNRKEQLKAAQAAKQQLCDQIGAQPWCTGIGLAPAADGGFALRVNVDSQQSAAAILPDSYQGVPIVRVEMRQYKKRATAGEAATVAPPKRRKKKS